jgi:hydroxymethylglutaryl-CoA lyase
VTGDAVRVVEMGPRDGLQNEPVPVPAAERITLIRRLAAAGLTTIEAGAFVSRAWVPQMAESDAVLAGLGDLPGLRLPVLVPNMKGFEAAVAAGAREVAVFASASEPFSRRNINASIAESLERFRPVIAAAAARAMPVRGYVSCALGCPYQGPVDPGRVAAVAADLATLGCAEVSVADTIGVGTPRAARDLLLRIARDVPMERLAVHFHDTWGQALANVLACLEAGVRTVDAAVGGLGGCPYARGATGNLATEDLVYMLDGLGMRTGVDLDRLAATGRWIAGLLGRPVASRAGRALAARSTDA